MEEQSRTNPLVLVYTDDVDFYLFLDHAFQAERLSTHLTVGLDETLPLSLQLEPDAILIDFRTQTGSASEICIPLRSDPRTRDIPIVALVDQGAERDYVELIKCGIDNTFIRPILPSKLINCVRSVIPSRQRTRDSKDIPEDSVRYADVEMDLVTYRVRRNGQEVHLSPIEFKLLRYFLERPERVLTRKELHNAAWQQNVHVGPRTVDVHVGRLRKALGSDPDTNLIRTVRSIGYALSIQQASEQAAAARSA